MRFGSPVRFPVAVIAIWIGARIWIVNGGEEAAIASEGHTSRVEQDLGGAQDMSGDRELPERMVSSRSRKEQALGDTNRLLQHEALTGPARVAPSALATISRQREQPAILAQTGFPRPPASHSPQRPFRAPTSTPAELRRPSGPFFSGWALWRSGAGQAGLAPGGQLGASQAGFRTRLPLARSGGLTLSANARLSRAIERPRSSEGALGVSVRPDSRLPVELIAERRFDLGNGGRNAWALGIAGGVSRRRLPLGLEWDAYAQVGVVGATSRDAYADGALGVSRPVAEIGAAQIALGGELRAAAQPGLARLDAGPELILRMPVGEGSLRLSAGYRFRLAGNARPDSGLALTAGTDF